MIFKGVLVQMKKKNFDPDQASLTSDIMHQHLFRAGTGPPPRDSQRREAATQPHTIRRDFSPPDPEIFQRWGQMSNRRQYQGELVGPVATT